MDDHLFRSFLHDFIGRQNTPQLRQEIRQRLAAIPELDVDINTSPDDPELVVIELKTIDPIGLEKRLGVHKEESLYYCNSCKKLEIVDCIECTSCSDNIHAQSSCAHMMENDDILCTDCLSLLQQEVSTWNEDLKQEIK